MARKPDSTVFAPLDLKMNTALLALAFAAFVLIVPNHAALLAARPFLTMQLVVAIPLFILASYSQTSLGGRPGMRRLERTALYAFMVGYCFLMNALGVFISETVGTEFGVLFILANIGIVCAFSLSLIADGHSTFRQRYMKDGFLIALLLLLGLLPALGIY